MKVDMSPEAIARRLNELNQLWKLCTTLSRARRISSANPTKNIQASDAKK